MDKGILFLLIIGVTLAVVHVSDVVITFGIIAALALVAIKLCWSILQPYSQTPLQSYKAAPVRSDSSKKS